MFTTLASLVVQLTNTMLLVSSALCNLAIMLRIPHAVFTKSYTDLYKLAASRAASSLQDLQMLTYRVAFAKEEKHKLALLLHFGSQGRTVLTAHKS
uniref:Uncharacterized protein n=1 Tax=Physcomitrium patens TaxID=3218 RepID=A0A7I3Z6I3_PHYPA